MMIFRFATLDKLVMLALGVVDLGTASFRGAPCPCLFNADYHAGEPMLQKWILTRGLLVGPHDYIGLSTGPSAVVKGCGESRLTRRIWLALMANSRIAQLRDVMFIIALRATLSCELKNDVAQQTAVGVSAP
jgi:hypothetical protein